MAKERLKTPRARLFIALDLPESLHLTLAFLGYLPEKEIGRLAKIVADLRGAAPSIELGDPVAKPALRRARIFALPANSPGAISLQGELEQSLVAARLYKPEKRAFWPHLTVARVKPSERGARRPAAVEKPPGQLPAALLRPVDAVRVRLYRSELNPKGARYTSLTQVELSRGGRQ